MKRLFLKLILSVTVLLSACSLAFAVDGLRIVGELPAETMLFSPLEIELEYSGSFKDPYNPKEILLEAVITLPSGETIHYPGFFDRQQSEHISTWAIRFTPYETGLHKVKMQMLNAGAKVQTEDFDVQVAHSAGKGFLQLPAGKAAHKEATYGFEFDSGKPFRGIGMNFGWESRYNIDTSYSIENYHYESFLGEMNKLGMNFFRTWMCPWNLPLEWQQVDSKRYSHEKTYRYNQSAIQKMDQLLEYAGEQEMYFMLALDYHGALKTEEDYFGGNNYWLQHPYNVVNGGPCKEPAEFFTHPEAKERYKNRLRFIMARWGYSPNIAVFEFWNEIDNATDGENIPIASVVAWHKEMAAYFKSIDPYQHMLSTSTSHRPVEGLFELTDLDFSQTHMYGHTDQMEEALEAKHTAYQKPSIIGEIGYDWRTPELPELQLFKDDLKLSLWRGLFSKTPVLPMGWWWEFLYENEGLELFKPVAAFSDRMLGVGSSSFEQTLSLEPVQATGTAGMEVKALKSASGLYAWVNNAAASEGLSEVVLQVENMGVRKEAKAYWYNITTGELTRLKKLRVKKGEISLQWKEGTLPAEFALIIH